MGGAVKGTFQKQPICSSARTHRKQSKYVKMNAKMNDKLKIYLDSNYSDDATCSHPNNKPYFSSNFNS